jgi:hypothetical protein
MELHARRLDLVLDAAWILLAIGAGVLLIHHPTFTGRGAVIGGIGLLAGVCFLPVLLRRTTGVSPATVYALATFATFALGGLAWLGRPVGAPVGLNQDAIAQAFVLASAGMAMFWLGYSLMRPPRDVRPTSRVPIAPVSSLVLLFGLGLVADFILFKTSRFGYFAVVAGTEVSWWQQWVQTTSGLIWIAPVLAAVHAFGDDSRPHRRAMILMLIVACMVGLISGFKGSVLLPLELTLFVFYYYRRRLPLKLMVVGLIFVLVIVPANLAYRGALLSSLGQTPTSLGTAADRFGSTFDEGSHMSLGNRIAAVTQWGAVRFRNIDSLARIQQLTPSQIHYSGSSSYLGLPALAVLPRVLWPTKPTHATGVDFGRRYFGYPLDSLTSVPITQPGDLYVHAGWLSVIVGMAIVGAIAGILFRWLCRRESPAALLVYIAVLSVIIQIELDFANLAPGAFRAAIFAWGIGRLLYGRMPLHSSQRVPPSLSRGRGQQRGRLQVLV